MKVYLVKLAVLLAVMSFIFCTEDPDSPAGSDSSESMDFPEQPVFCSATVDDQTKIMDCAQGDKEVISYAAYIATYLDKVSLQDMLNANSTLDVSPKAEQKLGNHAWIFCSNFTTFVTNICNNTNHVFFNMTNEEEKTWNSLILGCEKRLGVTLPPTC